MSIHFINVSTILLIIVDNSALYGGAIYCQNCNKFVFTTPRFIGNYAHKGGSIYLTYSTTIDPCDLRIDMIRFIISRSYSLSDGGFMVFNGDKCKLYFNAIETTFLDI